MSTLQQLRAWLRPRVAPARRQQAAGGRPRPTVPARSHSQRFEAAARAVQALPTVQYQSEQELRAMSAHDLKASPACAAQV